MEQLQQHLGTRSESFLSGDHTNLYIRGLPADTNESMLASLFQRFGSIQSIRIFRATPSTGASRSFAFVKLDTVENSEAAIAALNGTNIAGNVLEVRHADHDAGAINPERTPPPSDNIYVKNLPAGFGDNDLKQLFSLFGSVTMCRVLHQGDSTGQGGAALVRFTSVTDASRAVQSLQGHRILGSLHPLIVRFADSTEIKAKKQAKQAGAALHRHDSAGPTVSQPKYNPYADSLGQRTAISYPGNAFASAGSAPGLSSGLGSFHYGPQDLVGPGAFDHVSGASAHGQGPTTTDPFFATGRSSFAPPTVAVASLYVKNLPPDANRLFLYEKFAPFGPILSVKILTDEQGASKGVGFVNFSDSASASKAAAALHNLPVGTRNLHVTFQTHRK